MRQFLAILVALAFSPRLYGGVKPWGHPEIEPRQSAALFVGVRTFNYKNILPVPYAVDDAVDLAYEVAIDRALPLVPPKRVVLALSGDPQKPRSRQKLKKLLAAGALRFTATKPEILRLLTDRARMVGKDGLLIVSFATHGVSEDGMQYLFAQDSLVDQHEASLSETTIADIVSKNAPRSLVLFDACRERFTRDRRTGDADPRSVAAFLRALSRITGHVVIAAAAAGDYAYDDDERRNGVFTAAVIDALRCGAPKDRHGFVTVDTLHTYVEKHVLAWIQEHKNSRATRATQLACEGQTKKMPLSICVKHTASASPPPPE